MVGFDVAVGVAAEPSVATVVVARPEAASHGSTSPVRDSPQLQEMVAQERWGAMFENRLAPPAAVRVELAGKLLSWMESLPSHREGFLREAVGCIDRIATRPRPASRNQKSKVLRCSRDN